MFSKTETIESGFVTSNREAARTARIHFALGLIAGSGLGIVFMLAITAAAERFAK